MTYGHMGKVLNKFEAESRNVPWKDVVTSSVFELEQRMRVFLNNV